MDQQNHTIQFSLSLCHRRVIATMDAYNAAIIAALNQNTVDGVMFLPNGGRKTNREDASSSSADSIDGDDDSSDDTSDSSDDDTIS